jgi:hypothetical protein
MNSGYAPSCATRVFDIAEALCRAVGNAIRPGFIQAVVALVVVRRIQVVRGRLLALEARFLAGCVLTRVSAGRVEADRRVRPSVVWRVGLRLPRRFGWLCGLVPGEAACFAGQLRVVLSEPGMVALLAACPQAVRVVAPLCSMLGIARSDYVPGERVVGVVSAPADDMRPAPVAVLESGAPCDSAPAGIAWVRFIPQ